MCSEHILVNTYICNGVLVLFQLFVFESPDSRVVVMLKIANVLIAHILYAYLPGLFTSLRL
jgi:hypothetical protein